jgi:hypothetical protein
MASRVWLGGDFSVPVFCRRLRLGPRLRRWEHAKSYEQQPAFVWMGGHGTEPYEQNTQQSPGRGLRRSPHTLQS